MVRSKDKLLKNAIQDSGTYFFEVLPIHPRPHRLESLTSYLMRLAAANGIQTVQGLIHLSFPTLPLWWVADFPMSSFGALPTITVCSEATLRPTTFYHLFCKFGRNVEQRRFLFGHIAEHVRYCPQCLGEQAYYRLAWRFFNIKGCGKHACQLLDVCGHCGRGIPLVTVPPLVGVCPFCKGDLRACRVLSLAEAQRQAAVEQEGTLEYLLTPQAWEASVDAIEQRIGQQLALLRKYKALSQAEVNRSLGITAFELNNIEQVVYGRAGPKGVNFQHYLDYAAFLGVPLPDVFDAAMSQQIQARRSGPRLSEEEVIDRIHRAVMELQDHREAITRIAICRLVHLSRDRLERDFPRAWALLESVVVETQSCAREQRERELFRRVLLGISQLKEWGLPITQRAVGNLTGIQPQLFQAHPQVLALFEPEIDHQPLQEQELLTKMEAAITQLEKEGKRVTQAALVERIGVSSYRLKKIPCIQAVLQRVVAKSRRYGLGRKRQSEKECLSKIEATLALIAVPPKPITEAALCRMADVSLSNFYYYAMVKARVKVAVRTIEAGVQATSSSG